MNALEVAKQLSEQIKETKYVDAIFLKGSLARGEEDEFSNIDMYCLVSKDKITKFLAVQLEILETYQHLIYIKQLKSDYNQIIAIYENNLRIDLYILTKEQLTFRDKILILFDPKNILKNYIPETLSYSEQEASVIFDEFCCDGFDFYKAFQRKDWLLGFHISCQLHDKYTKILRYAYDFEYAYLGYKNFYKKMDKEMIKNYLSIIKSLKIETLGQCVQFMFNDINNLLSHFPITFVALISYDFYCHVNKMIFSI